MNIGFLTSDLHHGHGWGHYSLSLLQAIQRQGVRVTVAAAQNSPTDFDFPVLPVLPNVVPAAPRQLARLMLAVPAVRRAFRDVDLLHTVVEPYAPLAMWTAAHRPYFITAHGSYVKPGAGRHPAVQQLHRSAFLRAHTLTCDSHYTARRAAEYLPERETTVVTNGIDPERFAALPPPSEPTTRPTLLTAGGVKRRKGTLELVRAMAKVREHIPEVQCIIAGRTDSEPGYAAQVNAAIDDLDLRGHVRLLGFVPEHELMGWYNAANLFVLPSLNVGWKFEGYGLVHMEASAAGLPVIGTRECGAEDAIDAGVTGLLVSQTALDAELPAAIVRLLTNPELARQMGEAGKVRAQQQTWDRSAGQMIALYKQALA